MRHRSPTNSRKHENLTVRRNYMKAQPFCEVSPLLPRYDSHHVYLPTRSRSFGFLHCPVTPSSDPHHILGGKDRRWDIITNLIAVCRAVHDWGHRFRADFTALCVMVKLRKGEFDVSEMSRIKPNFPGWFECLEPKLRFDVGREAWREVMGAMEGESE